MLLEADEVNLNGRMVSKVQLTLSSYNITLHRGNYPGVPFYRVHNIFLPTMGRLRIGFLPHLKTIAHVQANTSPVSECTTRKYSSLYPHLYHRLYCLPDDAGGCVQTLRSTRLSLAANEQEVLNELVVVREESVIPTS